MRRPVQFDEHGWPTQKGEKKVEVEQDQVGPAATGQLAPCTGHPAYLAVAVARGCLLPLARRARLPFVKQIPSGCPLESA